MQAKVFCVEAGSRTADVLLRALQVRYRFVTPDAPLLALLYRLSTSWSAVGQLSVSIQDASQ
ncbi:MAG: hypothetical protein O9249_00485 [Burkholderiaceae bacterium]|nr:hypothetical protein [Burkholderiaceae bacterium]